MSLLEDAYFSSSQPTINVWKMSDGLRVSAVSSQIEIKSEFLELLFSLIISRYTTMNANGNLLSYVSIFSSALPLSMKLRIVSLFVKTVESIL
jgi:hypothetical protein